MTWYAGDPIEQMTFHMRYFGPWGSMFWMMVMCNCVIPLLLFSPRIRVNLSALWIITIFVNIGMWLERFVIIAGSLTANFKPSQWGTLPPVDHGNHDHGRQLRMVPGIVLVVLAGSCRSFR